MKVEFPKVEEKVNLFNAEKKTEKRINQQKRFEYLLFLYLYALLLSLVAN